MDVLVISNPSNAQNQGRWWRPIYSAFTDEEVKAVDEWVASGGRLWLIADHIPFAGAAANLAKPFGATFHDGFGADTTQNGATLLCRSCGTLANDPIVNGIRP